MKSICKFVPTTAALRRLFIVTVGATAAWVGLATPAHAVPSFARQTGAACADCHLGAFGPQLTPFGQQFKLQGYTMTDGAAGHVPLSAMLQSSFERLKTAPSDPTTPQHMTQWAQQASLFVAGRFSDHIGAFIQATGTGEHGTLKVPTLAMDNAEIRYANSVTLGGKSTTVGVSLNNNPTMTDIFNTLPAWRFPYIGPDITPGPDVVPKLVDGLGQQVLGLNAYALVDSKWYLELGGYGGQPRSWLESTNVLAASDGYDRLSGVNPYWRLAYMGKIGSADVSAGLVGLNAHIRPDSTTGTDKYTDIGIDGSYQLPVGKNDMFALNGAYITERQKLDVSDPGVKAHVRELDLSASYHFDQTYGVTAGLFNVSGSSDLATDTRGYTLQADWTPFGKSGSWGAPWANARLGLQYTWFDKLNGSSANASDNNTLYAFIWTAF
jgi:hypothetical protein